MKCTAFLQRFFEISVQKEKRDDTGTGLHAALPAEVPQEMEKLAAELIKAAQVKAVSHDLFRYAAFIHNKIVEIYPYGEDDKLLARCATAYYIMTKDFPAVASFHQRTEIQQYDIRSHKEGRSV